MMALSLTRLAWPLYDACVGGGGGKGFGPMNRLVLLPGSLCVEGVYTVGHQYCLHCLTAPTCDKNSG